MFVWTFFSPGAGLSGASDATETGVLTPDVDGVGTSCGTGAGAGADGADVGVEDEGLATGEATAGVRCCRRLGSVALVAELFASAWRPPFFALSSLKHFEQRLLLIGLLISIK